MSDRTSNRYHVEIRRAALPEVLFAADVAIALGVADADASEQLNSGVLGRTFLIGGRRGVLRTEFLRALEGAASGGHDLSPRGGHASHGAGPGRPEGAR